MPSKAIISFFSADEHARQRMFSLHLLMLAYFILLFLSVAWPLDFILDPSELVAKWKQGRILIQPFADGYWELSRFGYFFVLNALPWLPVALYLIFYRNFSFLAAVTLVIGLAVFRESLNLFVFSSITNIDRLLASCIGGVVGAGLGIFFNKGRIRDSVSSKVRIFSAKTLFHIVFLLGCLAVNFLFFWQPYDFHIDKSAMFNELARLKLAPFFSFKMWTEPKLLMGILLNIVLFFPFGFQLFLLTLKVSSFKRRFLLKIFGFVSILGIAFLVEAGQLLLPSRYFDLNDCLYQFAGGLLGFMISAIFYRIFVAYLYRFKIG